MSSTMSSALASGSQPTYTTPTKRAALINAEAGPSRARPAGASPAYSSRKHSLYGIEDRIVIEPGSRTWKVGFSGEVDPRAIFPSVDGEAIEAWDLGLSDIEAAKGDVAEARRIIGGRVLKSLRSIYTRHLMTDPKARKVIVVENTYLPSYIKDEIAKALFDNLKAPSLSFSPSSVLSLAACGRITGLVMDSGWLETTVTPVYHSRLLFHLARATPVAGRTLHRRLRALLHHHAKYYPPPTSFSSLSRRPIQPVPLGVLSDELIQRIIRNGCFVSNATEAPTLEISGEDSASLDNESFMKCLKARYEPGADATDLRLNLEPLAGEIHGMGPSTLVVPGWVRERAAEVLFEDGDNEADNITDLILQCLLKLPIDLRPIMISSMLMCGGTPSLPGFIPRLRSSLLSSLRPPAGSASTKAENYLPLHTPESRQAETKAWRKRHNEPYKELYAIASKLAILNDPCPLDGEGGGSKGGSAPRWKCGLMSWVGGSLAGALKTGGPEMLREEYDTLTQSHIEKGDLFAHRLAEEGTILTQMLSEPLEQGSASVPPPSGSDRTEVGIQIEDLLPGMAIGGGGQRKRGWNSDLSVGDWSRVVKA